MTNTHHIFGRHAALTAVCLVLFACTAVVPAVGQASAHLSKKELKTLSASPAGQERLAAYCRDKAQHLRAKAEEFSKEAPPFFLLQQSGSSFFG